MEEGWRLDWAIAIFVVDSRSELVSCPINKYNQCSDPMAVHPLGQALFSLSPEFIGIARAGRGRTGIPTSRD